MQLVFSVAPTLLELFLVSHILYQRCGPVFAGITLTTFSVYLLFTVWITQVLTIRPVVSTHLLSPRYPAFSSKTPLVYP